MNATRESVRGLEHKKTSTTMFTRTITSMGGFTAYPGELTLNFVDIGGSQIDPFPMLQFSMINPSEAETYDFETEEVSGVCTVKYLYRNHVMRKQELTDVLVSSPILIMQDLFSPIAYLYPDKSQTEAIDEFQQSKSGRQEVEIPSNYGLPIAKYPYLVDGTLDPIFASVRRYAIKGNWHFFSDSIICDTISIFVRRRIKSGIQIQAFNFL